MKKLNLQNLSRPEAFQTGISKLVRKTALQQIPQIKEPILDACCGNGIFLLEYCASVGNYANITGVDLDGDALKTARQLFLDNELQSPDFLLANAMSLPFENESFFTIFCLNTLINIHPFQNIEAILTELYRLLKPKGKIFVDFRNQKNPLLNYRYKKNIKTGALTTYAHKKSDFYPILEGLKINNYKFLTFGNSCPFLAKGFLLTIEK